MASTDLGQKMRDALEATLPDAEVAVRRVARQRALRLAQNQASPPQKHASGWLSGLTARVMVGGVSAGALLVCVVAYGPWWTEAESVSVEPSLERDLELLPRMSHAPDAAPNEQTPLDIREQTALDIRKATAREAKAPAHAPSEGPATEQRPAAARTPTTPLAAIASGDTDARWARVTEAMREGDWEAAKVALDSLSAKGDPETKDSARLLRIRIELSSSGNQTLEPRWQAELSELARSGSTSSIRASARRLLENPSGAPNGERKLAP